MFNYEELEIAGEGSYAQVIKAKLQETNEVSLPLLEDCRNKAFQR